MQTKKSTSRQKQNNQLLFLEAEGTQLKQLRSQLCTKVMSQYFSTIILPSKKDFVFLTL